LQMKHPNIVSILLSGLVVGCLFSCGHKKAPPKQKVIVADIRNLDEVITENIGERLSFIEENDGRTEDSIAVLRPSALRYFYEQGNNAAQWSAKGAPSASVQAMLTEIQQAEKVGLLPEKYHAAMLTDAIQHIQTDTEAHKDAALWARVDVMMTDAFMKMATHLHYGIAPRDSITLRKDSTYSDTLLVTMLQQALKENNVPTVLHSLEPVHAGYVALKAGIAGFKEKYDGRTWDTLPLNYTDTAAFKILLTNRLVQGGYVDTTGLERDAMGLVTDTTVLKKGVKAFQQEFNIYADGIAGKRTVAALNKTPHEWIIQAALNMDRWRKLPDTMQYQYIMVNIPGYMMQVIDSGTVQLESRVIVGTPRTRTPLLNSVMTNFMLYPYWRVPYSIVFKEMLPAIKKDVGYLAKKNLEVIDYQGNVVDPYTIDWTKLGKGHFPYVLRQMDGVDNSLGIMKFNFQNKYSVYLHDTNSRGLFKNSFRAMSHGCVRVQQWDSLAMYLIRGDTVRHPRDSVKAWISREEKKQVDLARRIPIYLRYFTAEGKEGTLLFHDDIYGEDKILRRKMAY
jgi:murein L,D-transpeptidase YcbB/YkuD